MRIWSVPETRSGSASPEVQGLCGEGRIPEYKSGSERKKAVGEGIGKERKLMDLRKASNSRSALFRSVEMGPTGERGAASRDPLVIDRA